MPYILDEFNDYHDTVRESIKEVEQYKVMLDALSTLLTYVRSFIAYREDTGKTVGYRTASGEFSMVEERNGRVIMSFTRQVYNCVPVTKELKMHKSMLARPDLLRKKMLENEKFKQEFFEIMSLIKMEPIRLPSR